MSQTRLLARVHVAAERALLLVWPVHDDEDGVAPAGRAWDADALDHFLGDVVLHVGNLKPVADRLVNTSKNFGQRLRDSFELVRRVPIASANGCRLLSGRDVEALTVWRRRARGDVLDARVAELKCGIAE